MGKVHLRKQIAKANDLRKRIEMWEGDVSYNGPEAIITPKLETLTPRSLRHGFASRALRI